jgi:hypothetical protein
MTPTPDCSITSTTSMPFQRLAGPSLYLSLRTLVGEDDGLAVALPHGGLLWNAVRASLVMHPDRRVWWCCGRGGTKVVFAADVGVGVGVGVGGQVGRLLLLGRWRGSQAVVHSHCLLNTREAAMVYSVLCRAGGGQELHGSLKGGSHF